MKNISSSLQKYLVIRQLTTLHTLVSIGMFHQTTIYRGDNYTGKNFVPPIKTRSPVVKAVKLMAWR